MRRNVLVAGFTVVALSMLFLALCGAGEEPSPAMQAVVPLELTPVEREAIPMDRGRLAIPLPRAEEAQDITVVLRRTSYRCRLLEVREGEPEEWRGTLHCYELDSDAPYTWALWSSYPLAGFRLLVGERGENYLAWVKAASVNFAEVSKARDRCVALVDGLLPRQASGITCVPLAYLVPEVHGWGVDAFNADIRILSVAKDGAGNWTVKITGPDEEKVYTLVSENGQWRRQE